MGMVVGEMELRGDEVFSEFKRYFLDGRYVVYKVHYGNYK
jgi:hypothetical protein